MLRKPPNKNSISINCTDIAKRKLSSFEAVSYLSTIILAAMTKNMPTSLTTISNQLGPSAYKADETGTSGDHATHNTISAKRNVPQIFDGKFWSNETEQKTEVAQ